MGEETFNDMLERIKDIGETEKRTIEIAEEIVRIIGDLADARVKSGLTQRQLAEKSGIKQSAIARMESLRAIPRLDTVISVARCLNAKIKIDTPYTSKPVGVIVPFPQRSAINQYQWNASTSYNTKPATTVKEAHYAAIG